MEIETYDISTGDNQTKSVETENSKNLSTLDKKDNKIVCINNIGDYAIAKNDLGNNKLQ